MSVPNDSRLNRNGIAGSNGAGPVPEKLAGGTLETLRGRELDALVAEVVFKWETETAPKDANGENGGTRFFIWPGFQEFWKRNPSFLPPLGKLHPAFLCPKWSESRSDVQEVLRHVLVLGMENRFLGELDKEIGSGRGLLLMMAMPHQICRAAIRAFRSQEP